MEDVRLPYVCQTIGVDIAGEKSLKNSIASGTVNGTI